VFLRYDTRGVFSFDELKETLRKVLNFVAYLIWEENSSVEIGTMGANCDFIVVIEVNELIFFLNGNSMT
jgi:hypothetical protein